MAGSSIEGKVRALVFLAFVLGGLLGLEAARITSWLPMSDLLRPKKASVPGPLIEAPTPSSPQTREEKEYAEKYLALDQTQVVEIGTGDLPGTRLVKATGRAKNNGTKTVRSMRACIWFKDESGRDIWEHEAPIFVVREDWTALRPGYVWHFLLLSKATPVEWQKGKQEIDITDVAFQR